MSVIMLRSRAQNDLSTCSFLACGKNIIMISPESVAAGAEDRQGRKQIDSRWKSECDTEEESMKQEQRRRRGMEAV
eukprot:758190-Hanusia_phi.AAC.1